MTRLFVVLTFFIPVFCFSAETPQFQRFEFERSEMGTLVRLVFYLETNETKDKAESTAEAIFAQFSELNQVFSDYDSDSEIMQLCSRSTELWESENRAVSLSVSEDMFAVLKESKRIGELSDGAFDISVGPLVRLWRRAKHQNTLPTPSLLEQRRSLVGLSLWDLDESSKTLSLEKPDMRLDFGGIAKGYAVDKAIETALKHGVSRILVDAGGDIRVGTAPPDGWKIGAGEELLQLENIAIAGSGSTEKFVEIDGIRYSHIVNPKTGIGLINSPLVYVTAPTAMEADALASAISVLGAEKGIALIDSQKNTAAKMIYTENGKTQVFISKKWKSRYSPSPR
ncbi:MAG: FAD:protein FMN transferase [Planctomycetaceae bacterium]|nr:FAD:protein FMN transferase [Planctomycetaceae bacterium]